MGVDIATAVLIITGYQLVLLLTALPVAALGEKIGVTRLYRIGLGCLLMTSLACGFAAILPSPYCEFIPLATSSQASWLRLEMTTRAPCAAKRLGNGATDPARRTRNHRHLVGKIEQPPHDPAHLTVFAQLAARHGAVVNFIGSISEAQRAHVGIGLSQAKVGGHPTAAVRLYRVV